MPEQPVLPFANSLLAGEMGNLLEGRNREEGKVCSHHCICFSTTATANDSSDLKENALAQFSMPRILKAKQANLTLTR